MEIRLNVLIGHILKSYQPSSRSSHPLIPSLSFALTFISLHLCELSTEHFLTNFEILISSNLKFIKGGLGDYSAYHPRLVDSKPLRHRLIDLLKETKQIH